MVSAMSSISAAFPAGKKNRVFCRGFPGQETVIYAEAQANDLKALVLEKHPNTRFIIEPTTALCSFYAEAGGLMIGFEGGYNQKNNNIDF